MIDGPSLLQERVLYKSSLLAQWSPEEAAKLPAAASGVGSSLAALLSHARNADCADRDDSCVSWAKQGECIRNAAYMNGMCKRSCNKCGS